MLHSRAQFEFLLVLPIPLGLRQKRVFSQILNEEKLSQSKLSQTSGAFARKGCYDSEPGTDLLLFGGPLQRHRSKEPLCHRQVLFELIQPEDRDPLASSDAVPLQPVHPRSQVSRLALSSVQ